MVEEVIRKREGVMNSALFKAEAAVPLTVAGKNCRFGSFCLGKHVCFFQKGSHQTFAAVFFVNGNRADADCFDFVGA